MGINRETVDELFREEVLRARRMSPEEKLLAGGRLFELACRVTEAGIRDQFPDADPQRVQEILSQRLTLRRKLDDYELRQSLKDQGIED
jgi:hypothetical protein